MPTRDQRWGSRYGRQRALEAQRAEAERAQTVLTEADRASQVYRAGYLTETGVRLEEVILALDDAQAREFAGLRISQLSVDPARLTVSVEPMTWATNEFKQAILLFESIDEWQRRQARFEDRR